MVAGDGRISLDGGKFIAPGKKSCLRASYVASCFAIVAELHPIFGSLFLSFIKSALVKF